MKGIEKERPRDVGDHGGKDFQTTSEAAGIRFLGQRLQTDVLEEATHWSTRTIARGDCATTHSFYVGA